MDAEGKPSDKTQAERAEENGGEVPLPHVGAAYLFDWLCQVGPGVSTGMGLVPVPPSEWKAWSEARGTPLQAWELETLMAASRAYCNEQAKAADWPPFGDPDALYDDDVVAQKLEAGLSRLL